ncbi:MAG: hypothetical protein BWY28_02898 [bacterium ADurb.Bin236]|nr:MAG: hypothetical protein BWY28_02898 [bacterium ADurb.Bin236]
MMNSCAAMAFNAAARFNLGPISGNPATGTPVLIRISIISSESKLGSAARNKPAAPETNAAAMEVPLAREYPESMKVE